MVEATPGSHQLARTSAQHSDGQTVKGFEEEEEEEV